MAYRLTGSIAEKDMAVTGWPMKASSSGNSTAAQKGGAPSAPSAAATGTLGPGSGGAGSLGIGGIGGAVEGMDEEETRDAVFWRLDSLGYRVGLGIVDR
jgi:hypothetical protein